MQAQEPETVRSCGRLGTGESGESQNPESRTWWSTTRDRSLDRHSVMLRSGSPNWIGTRISTATTGTDSSTRSVTATYRFVITRSCLLSVRRHCHVGGDERM